MESHGDKSILVRRGESVRKSVKNIFDVTTADSWQSRHRVYRPDTHFVEEGVSSVQSP